MYFLLLSSIIAASLNNTLLHKFPHSNNVYRFNLHISITWLVMLFIMNHGHLTCNKDIFFWGITYGIVQVLFLIFKTLAMSNGPVSITTLIGNCSMLLSIFASVLIWNETLHIGHIIGISLLLCAILLCTKSDKNKAFSKIWLIYCLLFFILCGSVGIIFKLFAASKSHSYRLDMMIISTLTMILFLSTAVFFHKDKCSTTESFKHDIMLTIPCGIFSCFYNLCNLYLSGALPGRTFFPCFNGGVIILSAIFSKQILKEKFTQKQIGGLFLGTIAVSILGIL